MSHVGFVRFCRNFVTYKELTLETINRLLTFFSLIFTVHSLNKFFEGRTKLILP